MACSQSPLSVALWATEMTSLGALAFAETAVGCREGLASAVGVAVPAALLGEGDGFAVALGRAGVETCKGRLGDASWLGLTLG